MKYKKLYLFNLLTLFVGVVFILASFSIYFFYEYAPAIEHIENLRVSGQSSQKQNRIDNLEDVLSKIRPGLFKSTTTYQTRPLADKTIEKIRSQLKLQCIMNLNGEKIAYINIKGQGLKRCSAGENINDLFTVLNIAEKAVEISIIGEKVVLRP